MCGRYFIDSDEPTMGTMLSALSPETPIHGGEVFPSNMAPVITRHGELTTMLWGFPRFDGKGLIINARSETAAEKPMFRIPMQYGRCLIPASWYFEWEQSGTAKVKHAIRTLEPVLYLAGLSRQERNGQFRFVILTRPACASIRYIHDRMPVIFPPALHDPWLHGRTPVRLLEYVETGKIIEHSRLSSKKSEVLF